MGIGDWKVDKVDLFFMPYALCPMPYAPCPMPHALCPNDH
ncbi:histidine kinase [Nostoc sp. CMAA1605]|nr:histidine kinase [Nostoc sp. CMAA1605]